MKMIAQNLRVGVKTATLGLLALMCLSALAATNRCTVTLAWDPSPATNVVGYNVYWGHFSRGYTQMVNCHSNQTVTLTNMISGSNYFFAATAYDDLGLESDYSEEAAWRAPVVNGPKPPGATKLLSVSVQTSTNMVDWRTVATIPALEFGVTNGTHWFRSVMDIR